VKATRKIVGGLLGAVVAVYALNAGIIFFTQPVSVQNGAEQHEHTKIGTNQVVSIDGLLSGGVGLWSKASLGYVNVLSEDPIIYINGDYADEDHLLNANDYLYKHEFAHILQKELIAEKSGGYPSYLNPISSGIYYYNLIKLNGDLEALMPQVRDDEGWIPFPGLEAAAECYAQPHSSPEEKTFFQAPYLYPGHCTAEQKKIAMKLFGGHWPEPLTAEERAELIPTNLTNESPTKVFGGLNGGFPKALDEYFDGVKKNVEKFHKTPRN
jgi:hypothetical protein